MLLVMVTDTLIGNMLYLVHIKGSILLILFNEALQLIFHTKLNHYR